MKAGKLTAEKLVESCLERIHAREETVHAWVEVYEREALAEARRCDREFQAGPVAGTAARDPHRRQGHHRRPGAVHPLRNAGLPGDRSRSEDAPVIARLRNAGAIFLGKTETTPFANNDPTITRNPWNPDHTPGGSSSGSGAAVADRMCPAALGTQTGGSLLRPAAYNGIVGFKATYGEVSTEGVLPNSWTIDHVGFHCRSAADAALLWPCMREKEPRPFARMPEPPLCSRTRISGRRAASRLHPGVFRGRDLPGGPGESRFRPRAAPRPPARRSSSSPSPPPLPSSGPAGASSSRRSSTPITARLFEAYREEYPPKLKIRLEKGAAISGHEYVEHLRYRILFQREMCARMADVDAVIMPIASTTAPRGLSSTGSSVFNQPWSVSGFPAMSLPTGLDANGLPFAMQMAAQPYGEERLLDVAAWCEKVLGFTASPTAGIGIGSR